MANGNQQPVALDLSKSVPLDSSPSSGGVTLDLNKSVSLDAPSNQSGEVLPADVAARHARFEGRNFITSDAGEGETGLKGAAVGIGKEGTSTLSGLGNLANKFLPSGLQIPTEQHEIETYIPEGSAKQRLLAESKAELTPHGLAEGVGATAENVLEWMGGEEALKGLSLGAKLAKMKKVADFVEEYPRMAKLLHVGSNVAKSTAIGATQGAIKESASGGAGATQGAIAGGEGGATGGATGEVLGGIGKGVKAIKNYVTRNPEVEQMGRELVTGLTEGATPEQVARTVEKNLAEAEDKMHSTYDTGMKEISAQGQSVPVPIAGSPLQQTAKELLSDSNVPESVATTLKGVIPDSAKIEPFLKQMSESTETMSWDGMEATRQKIGGTIRKLPWDSPIRPDLIKLRYAIDDTLEKAASDAGNHDLSDQIKTLRSGYAQTKGALEERAITALREKNPNAIADVLLSKSSVHDVTTLRRLIGPENMKSVEGSILDKMIQDASKNGSLQGRQLFRRFNGLGPDAKQAIWGSRLPQITEFMQAAGSLPNVVLDKIVSHYAPYAGAVPGAIYGAVSGFEHDGVSGAAKGAAVGATTGLGISAVSTLLRNPRVLDAALKAIKGLQKGAPRIVGPAASQALRSGEEQSDGEAPIAQNTDTSNWVPIALSDGQRLQIHPEDLAEAKRRDPGLQVING